MSSTDRYRQALQLIRDFPIPEQDNMISAAMRATARQALLSPEVPLVVVPPNTPPAPVRKLKMFDVVLPETLQLGMEIEVEGHRYRVTGVNYRSSGDTDVLLRSVETNRLASMVIGFHKRLVAVDGFRPA